VAGTFDRVTGLFASTANRVADGLGAIADNV
jgi:hypothetical protein